MAREATQNLSLYIPIQYSDSESVGFAELEWNIQLLYWLGGPILTQYSMQVRTG